MLARRRRKTKKMTNRILKQIDGVYIGSSEGEAVVFIGGAPLHLYIFENDAENNIEKELAKLPKTPEEASVYASSFGLLLNENEAEKEAQKCRYIEKEIRKMMQK